MFNSKRIQMFSKFESHHGNNQTKGLRLWQNTRTQLNWKFVFFSLERCLHIFSPHSLRTILPIKLCSLPKFVDFHYWTVWHCVQFIIFCIRCSLSHWIWPVRRWKMCYCVAGTMHFVHRCECSRLREDHIIPKLVEREHYQAHLIRLCG